MGRAVLPKSLKRPVKPPIQLRLSRWLRLKRCAFLGHRGVWRELYSMELSGDIGMYVEHDRFRDDFGQMMTVRIETYYCNHCGEELFHKMKSQI